MMCPLCNTHHDGNEMSPGAMSVVCEKCTKKRTKNPPPPTPILPKKMRRRLTGPNA